MQPEPAVDANERERILAEYARREERIPRDRYSLINPSNLFAHQQKNRTLLKLLAAAGFKSLEGALILDVGCGEGQQLLDLLSWGAQRRNLAGIDLVERRIAHARDRLATTGQGGDPEPDLRVGDATQLPWADSTFHIALQNTVFTSILDVGTKKMVANEILRVLKPGGYVVWYDFLFNNPQNSQVQGVDAREIRSLFPACLIRLQRITLAPPIARRLVPISWIGSLLLEKLVVLNTHYLAIIRKAPAG